MFLIILNIFLFPLLITLLFFTHVVSPLRLKLHFIREKPLPPFIFDFS